MNNKEAVEWLKSIKERIHGGDERYDQKRHEALDMAISALERQTGEWKFALNNHERCSVCGEVEKFAIDNFDYCPHCGARMTNKVKQWFERKGSK